MNHEKHESLEKVLFKEESFAIQGVRFSRCIVKWAVVSGSCLSSDSEGCHPERMRGI